MLSWDDFEEKEVKPLPQTEIKSPVKEESQKSLFPMKKHLELLRLMILILKQD